MSKGIVGLVLAVTVLLSTAVVADAQTQANCSFHFFQPPSSFSRTLPKGINRYGTVVGDGQSTVGQAAQAFIRYADGSIKTFALNGNLPTEFYRRNANGVTVGGFRAPSGKFHGLVYSNGSTREVDYPNTTYTVLTGINLYSAIVGFYLDANRQYQGFEFKGGSFTSIRYPGALSTVPLSISDTGMIVGYYETNVAPFTHGFVLKNGTFTTLDHPSGNNGTTLEDINAAGTIAGIYDANENGNNVTHGFIYKNGTFEAVQAPNATTTYVIGINGYGVITGEAIDNNGSRPYTATCQ